MINCDVYVTMKMMNIGFLRILHGEGCLRFMFFLSRSFTIMSRFYHPKTCDSYQISLHLHPQWNWAIFSLTWNYGNQFPSPWVCVMLSIGCETRVISRASHELSELNSGVLVERSEDVSAKSPRSHWCWGTWGVESEAFHTGLTLSPRRHLSLPWCPLPHLHE